MKTQSNSNDLDIWDVLIDDSIETLNKYIAQHGLHELDENSRGLLSVLILEGRFALALFLIKSTEIDINQKDKNGYTPLHFAVQNNAYDVVKALLQKGANVNIQDKFGNTPLFKSVTENTDLKITQTLIHSGADIHVMNTFGYSPIHFIQKNMPELALT